MRKRITVALVGVTFAALAALAFLKDPFVAPMASGIYRLMFCLIAEYAPICIAGIAFLDLADDLYRHIKKARDNKRKAAEKKARNLEFNKMYG